MYVSTLSLSLETSDPITDGCEPPCGHWELNSRPLDEQSVLLTTEPSCQPLDLFNNSLVLKNVVNQVILPQYSALLEINVNSSQLYSCSLSFPFLVCLFPFLF